MSSFTDSVDLLHRAMSVTQLRYDVTANNIANAGVPGYKRQVVNFESELKRAFDDEADTRNRFELTRTDRRHIPLNQPYNWRDVEPRRVTDWRSSSEANGNSVDAEYEAMNMLKLDLSYRLLTQLANFEFTQLRTAMRK